MEDVKLKHHVSYELDPVQVQPKTSAHLSIRLGRPRCAVGLVVRECHETDEQSVAAHSATPLRALAIRDIRAVGLRMQLLEWPLVAASGAVPGHMRHPGDLLGAVLAADYIGVGADSDMTDG
jgi:hypothetical protein